MMPNWFDRTDEEIIQRLKNVLRTEDFQFIGKYEPVSQKDFGFFKDVRSLSGVRKFYPKDDGSTDEKKIRPLEIYTKAYDKLVADKWYKFYAVPAANPLRKSKRNPFLLQTDWKRVRDILLLRGTELIENIKNDALNTPEGIAGNLMRAIETISIDINTEPTTFIFELIQNADDYPDSENNVSITFQIDNSHLIIKHNGSKFEVNNTVALCGVNEGDKREATNKIGFKGIGFKSIFKDANFAYIKSGDFSFRFDEAVWRQQGIEIFWHIIPINTPVNEFKQVLKTESNVNIVIRPRALQALKTYRETFATHFNDERILLFLRNVKSLIFDSAEEKFEISNSSSKWKIFTETNVEIPENETNELNRRINFPDKRIPVKFHDITLTELGFGFRVNHNKVESIGDGFIYAYLPTKVNLGFSFILNANFIPDASRTKIYSDLTWNSFLFEKAGELFIKQITSLLTEGLDKESVLKQIPNIPEILLNIKDDDKIIFINYFKKGFEREILNQQFIPTQSDTLETLSNILIDETGLADLLKDDFFKLTGIAEKLLHKDVGTGIKKVKALITEYKNGVVYGIEDLKADLKTPVFQEWLKIPANNLKIIQHFISEEGLQDLLKTENIILTESNLLNKSTSLFRSIPVEITFTPIEKISTEILSLLTKNNIKLALNEFEPVQFYKDNIFAKQNIVNPSLKDETNLLNFWKFIFDNWTLFESETQIKDSLKHFEVLCKPKTENEVLKKLISSTYLSKEFNPAYEIETIIREIEIQDAAFISEKYIDQKREIEKWRKIFKQATAITDLQKVIEILITKLPAMEDSKHFEIAKQIFKFWKDNKDNANKLTDSQIALVKANLKIKCSDKVFRKSTECFLSDHYNINQLIASWLPNIELTNQIAQEYAPNTNQIAEWKIFFVLIGAIELSDKQNVFDAKLVSFIENQVSLQDKHFEIIKSISDLYKAKTEKGLTFDFENTLSEIKLQTSNEGWHLPNKIHLSNSFKPKLTLQNDESIKSTLLFLNDKYYLNQIEKYFLTDIGVQNSFQFYTSELKRNEIPTHYRQEFEKRNNYIVQNAQQYANQHRLINHIDLNYKNLLGDLKYSEIFWKEVKKQNSKHLHFLFQESTYRTAFNSVSFENFVVNYIKQNATFPNQANELKKSTELYSALLADYITGTNDLPKYDLSEIYFNNDQTKSLESILGVQKLLSQEHCIDLLCRTENRITQLQITQLQIIKVLSGYTPTDDEKTKIFLLNKNLEWKPINKLFISKDEEFPIEPTQNLHEDFHSIADNFGIQELSEENLILKTKPKTPKVTNEIEIFLGSKAKFIAFKIDHTNYQAIETDIIEMISAFEFYEVTSIAKVFPEVSPIYKSEEFDFHFNEDENKILYKDNWRTNKTVIDFLFEKIQHDKIEKLWFENLINRWNDDKIIEKLNEEVGTTPPEWNSTQQNEKGAEETDFLKEVKDFIEGMREVEDIYDEDKVQELKSILESFRNQPEQKRKSFNLLAKLKLCKQLGLNYNNDWGFNKIDDGVNKFFIHSARGSFAYIHPNELLQMRNDVFKMAIDFGTNDIRIYNSPSEIIELYQNYLMLYQGKPSEEEILKLCEDTQNKAKFHFLIVDREKQTNDALAILKILNTESYE